MKKHISLIWSCKPSIGINLHYFLISQRSSEDKKAPKKEEESDESDIGVYMYILSRPKDSNELPFKNILKLNNHHRTSISI